MFVILTSSHLLYASTTMSNIIPQTVPVKSMYIRSHGTFGYSQWWLRNFGGTCACWAHSVHDLAVFSMSPSTPGQYTNECAIPFIFTIPTCAAWRSFKICCLSVGGITALCSNINCKHTLPRELYILRVWDYDPTLVIGWFCLGWSFHVCCVMVSVRIGNCFIWCSMNWSNLSLVSFLIFVRGLLTILLILDYGIR